MIFQGKKITVTELENNILNLCFDDKEGPVNKFDAPTLAELKEAAEKINSTTGTKGLLVTSKKRDFIVGADITEFIGKFQQPKEELLQWLTDANKIFSMIEDYNFPTVSCVNGFALGGGFEMALSTAYRVCNSKASVGLPETKLGLFPGFGGTIRLSRLIGADMSIEWIASGKNHKPTEALKVGAIDAVVEDEKLFDAGLNLLNQAIEGKLDWKKRVAQKKGPLTLNPIEAGMAFEGSKGFVAAAAGPNYPAPVRAIETLQKGAMHGRDEALKFEGEGFVEMAHTPTATSLVNIFLSDQYIKKKAKGFAKKSEPVKTAAVLGAGIMGGGVAYQSASKKIPIVMKDINQDALTLGLEVASGLLNKQVTRKKIDTKKMAKILSSISATLSYDAIKETDLVVEAVIENIEIKKSVLKETEAIMKKGAVLTSNTSTISINDLAKNLSRPEDFCGMHFFNPVHLMPLVEVIRGEKTSEETISKTVSYALALGKSPVVVNDCAGFLVNRILFPYLGAFLQLLNEGADYLKIDKVMEKFGWPMGPAYLMDVVGIDTAFHATSVMANAFPERLKTDNKTALDMLFDKKYYGQKNKKGFYNYSLDRKGKLKKEVNKEMTDFIKPLVKSNNQFTDEEIINRLMIPMITEASLCLQENIVETPTELDMSLVYGIGFPPFRGGLLRFADNWGAENLLKVCNEYASKHGALYEPTEQMKDLAAKKENFYKN